MVLSPKVYTWLCGLFASLGSIIFGYDLGVIAGATMGPDFNNPNLEGLITSIFRIFAGMFPVAYFADFLGRRKTIQVGALIYISMMFRLTYFSRFFAGFGVGIMADLAPLYQAEIAHPSIRGRLTTLQQTFGTSAGLKGTQAEWRVPLGIQIIPALPLVAFMLLLPESPRWLAEKGRIDEAAKTLARLHAHGNVDDPFVISQMEDIKAEIQKAREIGAASWGELFTVPSNFRRVALGYILQFSVQMTGVSAIQYYSTTIFTTMGFTATRVLLFQSINSIIALIGEVCCVLWVDNTGRRKPLIVGNVLTTWVFNFFFSACIGPLSWAYPAEIYSTRTRAKATALTSSASWLSNFFIAQVTPIAFQHIGWNALFIWAFYPETSGRRLEEMDTLFEDAPLFVANTPYAKTQNR
ncbi:general substrate transporter [Gymnopus androsaceus JB14]|uniref:General substrate transporter n=1 Tax=Gymnopus androsaceus JB14 TaxID=1447944 RepID=A0A6A4HAC1_9AGAR|nr:general substrate transporter [Gymnopus androsaceus JB14]